MSLSVLLKEVVIEPNVKFLERPFWILVAMLKLLKLHIVARIDSYIKTNILTYYTTL